MAGIAAVSFIAIYFLKTLFAVIVLGAGIIGLLGSFVLFVIQNLPN